MKTLKLSTLRFAVAGICLALFSACMTDNDKKGTGAPSGLSYSSNPASYALNVAIANNTPTVTGTPTYYTVSPALPTGLKLDTVTGVISGTPTSVSTASIYTVTAGNTSGSTTAILSIAVLVGPSGLAYSVTSAFYAPGSVITSNIPGLTAGAALHYSASPALPGGLKLDTATGIISGTPNAELATTTYTITAANLIGSATAQIFITISHWIGLPKDSLQDAVSLLNHAGDIYVANRSSTSPGTIVLDSITGKITAYYAEQLPPLSMAVTKDNYLVITETNFTQGAVSVVDLSTKTIQKSVISFGSDNFVDTAGGATYLFDHTTGVITGFTGHAPNTNITLNAQTGVSSNPYGIAIASGKAFIPRYNSKFLLILDPTQVGGGTRDSIDLSTYVSRHPVDTAASAPRMAAVTAYNGYIFVTLQRLNYKYSALDTSLVVVINASTKAVVSTIPLHFRNPVAAHAVGSTWFITSIAGYGDQAGGVEKIDLSSRTHGGNVITETALAADAFDFVPAGSSSGYVSYSTDFGFTTHVKKVSY